MPDVYASAGFFRETAEETSFKELCQNKSASVRETHLKNMTSVCRQPGRRPLLIQSSRGVEMADGDRQRIRRIHRFGGGRQFEKPRHHVLHLLFLGPAVT